MYDPVIGLFTTADIMVQNFSNPQTLNRYAYCGNNPLAYVDPSGHSFWKSFAKIITTILCGPIIARGIETGWDPEEMLKGIACDAASAALFYGAGSLTESIGTAYKISGAALKGVQVGLHFGAGAISGGINSAVMGGDIGKGMLTGGISGGVGCAAGGLIKSDKFLPQFAARTIAGGVSGGIAAEISGRKFMDGFAAGAKTAATGYLFNHMLHRPRVGGLIYHRHGDNPPSWGSDKEETGAVTEELPPTGGTMAFDQAMRTGFKYYTSILPFVASGVVGSSSVFWGGVTYDALEIFRSLCLDQPADLTIPGTPVSIPNGINPREVAE